ncbi:MULTISPECIES: ROK family protein [Microbacterium]|uniref:Sugar kinase n=1 Tax=Microbacterium testaceum TaxID=2033 RepID=A0A4Y3QK82_MICTE|nr:MULTISPECIES: ROK family protein [Microbacterium]MDZ5144795.1 ROK family protein [Microbacterium testaceum]PNW10059.1 transcriptional regulator [Microbacterium testaceum]RED00097.1 putative NBD/HSP70 family sugar kinase [Microbacterium sp. AG157]WJS91192.1 ROK family protein [Microbacterium testaceum]GEB45339.1 sugar kinase [Microbacterium testaceum]
MTPAVFEPATPLAPPAGRTTNDLIRQQNLSSVLSLLHSRGALSRAQLGATTGLNRSTVTGLVMELTELGLVREAPSGERTGKVGRPTLDLEPEDHVAALSVRAEPHAVTVALVGLGGVVHARLRHDTATAPAPKRFVQIVASSVEAMRADIDRHYRVVGAGLAVPGLVNANGSVLVSPTLGWKRDPVAARLSDELGMPVAAGNDASIGALAESRFGVGVGVGNLLYLGGAMHSIGGGLIIDGTLLRGTSGYAGELGHTVVDPRGRPCVCGRRGCLEAEVSLDLIEPLLGRRKLDEDELDVELGVARNPRVMTEVTRQVEMLSLALTNFVNAFAPETVVLSGYLGALLSVSRERLADAVRVHPLGAEGRTIRLERAHLRSRLMLVGPAELAFSDLLANPAGFRG